MTPAWAGWLMLAAVAAAVLIAFCWPTDDDRSEHPGFDDLKTDAIPTTDADDRDAGTTTVDDPPPHVCRPHHPTGAGDRTYRAAQAARHRDENQQGDPQ